jgi:hypothetical protein
MGVKLIRQGATLKFMNRSNARIFGLDPPEQLP